MELVEFDHLITKKKLEEDDVIARDSPILNNNSRVAWTALGCPNLRTVQQGTVLQIERRGYYRVDRTQSDEGPMQLFMIPDGKVKACSTLSSKLAHR